MNIIARPLAPDVFSRFGHVLEAPPDKPRRNEAATLFNGRPTAQPNLATINAPVVHLPLRIHQLERHPHSTQTFVPLDVDEYLVITCVDDGAGRPALDYLSAFIANRCQGFNYGPNVWHHPISTLVKPGSFAMLVWEDGTASDCEFVTVTAEVTVVRG